MMTRLADIEEAVKILGGARLALLTGAGISTESGIPDYRGPSGSMKTRNPIQYREFISKPESRRSYWARSAVGWPRAAAAKPNAGHFALTRLEESGLITGLITQNVDGLHQAAGSRRVIELHGSLSRVICLKCATREARGDLQRRIESLNPGWSERHATVAPEGDAELSELLTKDFVVPNCIICGGILKPEVVFFGESVPRPTVEKGFTAVEEAEGLLVAGTSLAVYSGLRFVERALKREIPVVVVNLGPVRGEQHARVKIEAPLGDALPTLADRLIQEYPAPLRHASR